MTPLGLALVGALVVWTGGLLAAGPGARAGWQSGAALLAALVGVGTLWLETPRVAPTALEGDVRAAEIQRSGWALAPEDADFGAPLVARAQLADGTPASARVVLEREGTRRQVRRVDLKRAVPGTPGAHWALFVVGLAALVVLLRAGEGAARLALLATLAASLAAAAALFSVRGGGEGPDALRAFLEGVGLSGERVSGFTVPAGAWRFEPPGLAAACVASLVGAVALARGFLPSLAVGHNALRVGVLLCLAAPVWQMIDVGGLPWRPAEGAVWAVALLALGIWMDEDAAPRAGTLAGVALALAALAQG